MACTYTLAKLAQGQGFEAEECLEMLAAIDAPGDLYEFHQIAANLTGIWPLLPVVADRQEPWTIERMEHWRRLCQWIMEDEEAANSLPKAPADKRLKRGPLSRRLTKYPLYCALWSLPGHGRSGQALQHLRAQFIFARSCWKRLSEQKGKKYDSVLQSAGRWVRRLADTSLHRPLLGHLPPAPLSAEAYLDHLRQLQNPVVSDPESRRVLIRMLEYAQKGRGGYGRQRQGGGRNREDPLEVSHDTFSVHDPGDDRHEPGWNQREDVTLPQSHKRHAREIGLFPEETGEGVRLHQSRQPVLVEQGDSLQTLALRERYRSRHIAVHNLGLPYRWDRLNLNDVLHLVHGLGRLLRRGLFPNWEATERKALAALIGTMYWTASPFERARKARFVDAWDKLPQTPNPEDNTVYLVWKEGAWGWMICAPHLEQRRLVNEEQRREVRAGDDRVFLPLPADAHWLLAPWMKQRFRPGKRSRRLFPEADQARLQENLTAFISRLNRTCHTRLTEQRIAGHLYQTLTNWVQDETEAMLITGRMPPAGQKASLYYYAPEKRHLARQYAKTCAAISRAVRQGLGQENNPSSSSVKLPPRLAGHVGSRICPTEEAIQRLVTGLREQVATWRRHLPYEGLAVHEFHNAYTSYCLWMLLFATGYRAVRDPFHSLKEVDLRQGFVVISDKDGDDYFNSRLVWLPSLCLEQLACYRRHRQGLVERLWVMNPQTAGHLREESPPLFFYLDTRGRFESVSPATLSNRSKAIFTLPINANRHFLRTRLREKDVPGEIVDAFMGHWEHGQEPYGRYSSLSPMDYRRMLEAPLQEVLQESGWKVLGGLR